METSVYPDYAHETIRDPRDLYHDSHDLVYDSHYREHVNYHDIPTEIPIQDHNQYDRFKNIQPNHRYSEPTCTLRDERIRNFNTNQIHYHGNSPYSNNDSQQNYTRGQANANRESRNRISPVYPHSTVPMEQNPLNKVFPEDGIYRRDSGYPKTGSRPQRTNFPNPRSQGRGQTKSRTNFYDFQSTPTKNVDQHSVTSSNSHNAKSNIPNDYDQFQSKFRHNEPSDSTQYQTNDLLVHTDNSKYSDSVRQDSPQVAHCVTPVTNQTTPATKSQGTRFRRQRDPKSFDGVRIDWSDYITHFEAVADWNGWDDTQKAQQLIISLDGDAMKLLGQFSPEVKSNYDKLVAEMYRCYDPCERAAAYKIEFRGRKRGRNENLMFYAQELKRLVTKAYPDMPILSHEHFVVDQFIIGLPSLEMKKHVQFGHPKDISTAISLAIELEAFETANHMGYSKPKGDVAMVRPSDSGDEDSDGEQEGAVTCALSGDARKQKYKYDKTLTCTFCKRVGHARETCFRAQKHDDEVARLKAGN